MAPKKKSAAPKKSKQQREEERKAKEEAEEKRRAEELQKLEEDRKLKEEDDARRREIEARNRAAELQRLKVEEQNSREYNTMKYNKLQSILREKKEEKDWERYLACESRPAANVENDMNAYINAWLMESSDDIQHVAECCESACSVIGDLSIVGSDAMTAGDQSLYDQSQSYIRYLKKQIHIKIESCAAHILQFADEFTESSKNEFKLSSKSTNKSVKIGLWVNLIPKSSRSKRIDFEALGMSVDLPKSIVLQSLALQVTFLPFDLYEEDNMQNQEITLGGVFSVELLQLHSPPVKSHGWTIRQVPMGQLNPEGYMNKRIAYPLDGTVASAALPIRVTVELPSYLIMRADVRIGWWDRSEHSWQEDGIEDVEYNAGLHHLTFTTRRLGSMAILRPRNLDSERIFWMIRANNRSVLQDENAARRCRTALLTIKTTQYDCIRIEINEEGCRLLDISDIQLPVELKTAVLLSPSELMLKLYSSGIGLSPLLTHDIKLPFAKVQFLEDRVIQEITSIHNGFEVCSGDLSLIQDEQQRETWQKFSSSESDIVFAIREMFWSPWGESENEHPARAPILHVLASIDEQAPGGNIKFTLERVTKAVDTSDNTENPCYDTFIHLRNALQNIATVDAQARLELSDELYEYTLCKLLALLRLFSCSGPGSCR